ncbi:MAG: hypothetical protein Q4A79_01035, partial [Candidatus Saccharibacteria bacterium]|nr:hypothetical protein [Candidatus Saccharibacteria bacterium]
MENNKFLGSSDGYGGDGWGSLVTEDENEEEDSSDDGEFIPPYVAHALEKDGREARIKRKLEDSKGGKSYEQRREETEQRLGRAGFSRLNPSEQKAIEAGLQDYLDEQVNSSLSKEILLPEQVFTRLPSLFEFLNETIDDIPDVVSKYEQITDKKEQLKFLLKTSLADKVRLFCSGNFDYSNYDNFMCSLQFQQKIINGTAEVWKKEYDKHKGKYVDVREYLNPSSANSEGILLGLNRAALKAAMIGTPEYGAYKMALDIRRDSGKEIPPDFPRISGSRSKIKDSSIGPWEAIIDEYNKIADRVARRNPSLDEEDLEHKSVREAARIFAKSMEYNRFPNSSYESPFHVAVAWAQLGDAVQKQVQRLRQEDRGLDLNDIGRFIGKSGMNQTRASYEREKHYLEKTLAIFDKKRDLLNNLPDFVRNLNFKEYKRDIESQIERIEYKYRFATDMPELEENTISLAMKNKEAELAPLKYKLNIFKECENKPGILSNFITQWERERILKKKEYLNDTALPDVATLNQQEIQKLENWQEKETTRVNHKYDKLISKTRSEERKAEYERRREGELKALFLDCSKRREYFKHRTLEQLCSDIESRIKIISGRIEKRKSIAEKAIDLHLALMPRYDED